MSRIVTPADVLTASLPRLGLVGPVLLAGDAAPRLAEAVAALGLMAVGWNRRAPAGGPWPRPATEPAEQAFGAALLRLPRSRAEQDMSLHAVLSVVRPGGRLAVYGANDEGIKAVAARIAELTGACATIETRAHARVLTAVRPERVPGLRASLADWRRTWPLDLGGATRDWISYPGVFADGRLDEGTALLLAHLPALAAGDAVLDHGCGSGVVAGAVLARQPSAAIDMLDPDSVALIAAGENVPAARAVAGSSLAAVAGRRYSSIVSNPPLHDGHTEDHGILERLIAEAPAYLVRGGELRLVVQRRIPLERLLGLTFATVEIVAETGRFRVWRAAIPRVRRA